MEPISIDDLKKVEITVGEILSVERIEGSDKLLKLSVNFGPKPSVKAEGDAEQPEGGTAEQDIRQVLSGIGPYFEDIQTLVGKRYPFVTNLAPRMMMGLESQAMILATGGSGAEPFNLFETKASPGARAK
jgi:methionyl-tRNA synthetase